MIDAITAADIFTALVGALDRVGVDWYRAVSLVTDCAPSTTGRKAGVGTTFKEKVQAANGGCDRLTFRCMLHQEALCCKSLKMNYVMEVVVQTRHTERIVKANSTSKTQNLTRERESDILSRLSVESSFLLICRVLGHPIAKTLCIQMNKGST